jgi:hypothetical protein
MKKFCSILVCVVIIGTTVPAFTQSAKPAPLHIVDLINSGQITTIIVVHMSGASKLVNSDQFNILPQNILHIKDGDDYYLVLDKYRIYAVDGKKLFIYPW